MFTIQEKLEPIVREYNRFLEGHYLASLLQFKGQAGVGNEYVSKVFRAQSHQKYSKYTHAKESVRNPTYAGFLQDNWVRLVAFNAVERLIVAYQAAPNMSRVGRPNSLSFLFTEIMNDGAFRGTLRGASVNIIQSSLVLWPSIVLANRNGGDLVSFMTTFCTLDALLYPLDVIKNRMYAHTSSPKGLRDVLSNLGISNLIRGIVSKFIFNLPFTAALYSTTQRDENAWMYWLATAALYPFNTYKIRCQTSNTLPASVAMYNGVIPFILMNAFFSWELTALYSKNKCHWIKAEADKHSHEH